MIVGQFIKANYVYLFSFLVSIFGYTSTSSWSLELSEDGQTYSLFFLQEYLSLHHRGKVYACLCEWIRGLMIHFFTLSFGIHFKVDTLDKLFSKDGQ